MPLAGSARRTIVTHKQNLLDLTPRDAEARLRAFAADVGEPAYRASQVARRLWVNPAATFEAMTELPVTFRRKLDAAFEMPRLAVLARQKSTDGTEKFLFRLRDGQAIETVAIPEGDRLTLCISSQAGCALQCAFCATGAMGFQRNLDVHEIAGQVREMRLQNPPLQVSNIVFMGMGEPLMNWKAVDPVLTILNDPAGLGIGARHITVSTVGVLPGIEALAARPEQFRLAISIHAPSDALRRELMPINTKYPLASVIAAAKAFDLASPSST
jgi:23S rRNA (adenine2503-C2)-methyltransferase